MSKKATIIAVVNQKGGTGKTTTTENLGVGLALEGKKVLLVDTDPQASLTVSLGNPCPDDLSPTLSDLMGKIMMENPITPDEGILHHPEGVDLVPSNIELSGMEVALVNAMSRETILRQYLDTVKQNYDYILLDCMPSLGMLTVNALAAADNVLIPVQAAYLPAKGLEQLLGTINKVKRQINPKLRIEGILLTMVDNRTNYSKDISNLIRESYGGKLKVYKTDIPRSVRAEEISAEGHSIFQHDPKGKVADAYRVLTKEVLNNAEKRRKHQLEAKKRVQELEKLICRIYEDNILGKLPDERYTILDGQYSKEQKNLSAEIADMEAELSGYEEGRRSAEKFIALVDKYQNFDELTTYMLNEFVEKIVVHERDRKGSIETTQEVEIYFNFIGKYLPPHFGEVEMTPEEIEEMKKREARKDRLHQNYLKRKANGKQQEYYERTKAKKKAEMDAKKEEIRQEDIAKGVFIPVSLLPPAEPKKGVASA